MSIRSLIVFVVSTTVIAAGLTVTPVINPESQAPSQAAQAAVPGAVAAPAVAPADPPPPTYDEVVLADSPRLYYRLDETSGSFADSSGRGISGLALPGGAPWTANLGSALTNQASNKAAKFSGYNVNSQTSVVAGLPTANSARSIEWWAKADNVGPFAVGWGGFEVLQTVSTIKVGANTFQLPVTAMSNRWHHWVVSYDPAQSRLIEVFVDGKLAVSGNAAANYTTTDTAFKIRGTSLTSNPSVRFDEIAVYDTALTGSTALAHFDASGASRPTAVADLTATGGNGSVTAEWDAATADTPDSEPGVTGYRVSAMSGSDIRSTKWVPSSATTTTLTGLGSGTYSVKVQAANGFFGLGPAESSSEVDASTGSAYAASVKADDPLLYYRLGEATGIPHFADSSGRQPTGLEFQGGASLTPNTDTALPTDTDTSATFAGYNTSIATPNVVGLPVGNTARSTELWMRNNSNGGHFAIGWGGYELTFNSAGTIAGPSFTATPPVNPLNGSWHHVVVTFEPTPKTFRVYIDGELTNTHTIGTALAGTDGQLTIRGTSLTKSPNVKLDEIAIYGTQLSGAQILSRYQASGRAAPVTPENVTATAGAGYLDAGWDAVVAPQSQPATTGYRLHVMAGSSVIQTKWAGPSATTLKLSGLAAGDYTVVIQAANSNGFSAPGTTASQSVTAGDTSGYASTVRTDSPKVFYRMGEAAGSPQFADSSGRGVAGIDLLSNGALAPTANGGLHSDPDSAAQITGYDPSTVTVAPAGLPAGNTARTVEWWMRGTAGPAAMSWGGFEVLALNNHVKVGATTVPVPRPLLDDNWHHVAVTYSPSESRLIKVYVDGQLAGTANAAANVTGTDGTFKIRGASLSSASNVRLDEVAVYDTVLTQTRVQAHFDASGAQRPVATSASATGGNGFVTVDWSSTPGVTPDGQPATSGFLVTALSGGQPVFKRWTAAGSTSTTLGGLAPGDYTATVEPTNGFGRGTGVTTTVVSVTSGETDGYASTVRADSPKLFYRLGEGAGSPLLADSSGRAVDAFDLFNTARLTPGAGGALVADPDGSATINGFDPTIQTLNAAGLPTGNNARSVEWWVRGTTGPWSFSWGDFTVSATAQSVSVGPNATGFTHNLLDNNWHHVVATYDPSASRLIKIYIDGEVAASGNAASNLTGADGPFTIKGTNLSSATNVRLDDVAIYDTTLNAQKVKEHFDASGATRPSAAGELQATGGIGTIELSWAQPAQGNTPDGQPGATGYRVTASQGATAMMSRWLPADADHAMLSGLPAGDYTVAVAAINGFGFGTPAVTSTVTVTAGGPSYLSSVRADGPVLYYRAGEPEGAPSLPTPPGEKPHSSTFPPWVDSPQAPTVH